MVIYRKYIKLCQNGGWPNHWLPENPNLVISAIVPHIFFPSYKWYIGGKNLQKLMNMHFVHILCKIKPTKSTYYNNHKILKKYRVAVYW